MFLFVSLLVPVFPRIPTGNVHSYKLKPPDNSHDFVRALHYYRGVPSTILPGQFRGNLTAIVVLSHIKEMLNFVQRNAGFLRQGWHDAFFLLNDENQTRNDTLLNIPVRYVDVTSIFKVFPPGFDPANPIKVWTKRARWNYQQMIRFFTLGIWEVPALFPYGKLLRLDSDSRLFPVSTNPFDLVSNTAYAISGTWSDPSDVCTGLADFAEWYIHYFKLKPANAASYGLFNPGYIQEPGWVRCYNTNFWVINVHRYLELPGLLQFYAMVDASHGIFLYRWGDAPLFFVALAITAKPEELIWTPTNWIYKHG
jgi:hypothetical protein